MTIDFSYKPDSVRRDDGTLFPIAILADFSGRRHRPPSSLSLGRPLRIDCENFERVFAQFDVTLTLPSAKTGGDELVLRFRRLEDFHPDELLQQVGSLSRLLDLRTRLLNPATADAAVEESRELLGMPAAATGQSPSNSTETTEELLTRLLGKPAAQPPKAATVASTVESLIKRLVEPSAGSDLQQIQIVPLVEGELSKRLREVLHDPDFQAIEAAWRGVDFLIRGTGDQTKSYLIDITKSELTAMLAGGDLARTTIFKQLQEIGPAIVLGIYTFGLQDQSLLKALGGLAQAHHTAFVASAVRRWSVAVPSDLNPTRTIGCADRVSMDSTRYTGCRKLLISACSCRDSFFANRMAPAAIRSKHFRSKRCSLNLSMNLTSGVVQPFFAAICSQMLSRRRDVNQTLG